MNGVSSSREFGWASPYRTIVIEGCDGTGKTTLADRLATAYEVTVIHADRTPNHIDLTTRYLALLARPGRIVLDRSFLSEPVYGPLYRGGSRLTPAQVATLARAVADRGGVCVHLTAPAAAIADRIAARGDPTIPSLTEIKHILTRYERVFAAISGYVPIIRIDTTDHA
jgi:thymidylate kinase